MGSRPGQAALDTAGFWAMWSELRSRGGVAATVDRLRELGISRSTVYRQLAAFRDLTGGREPEELTAAELVDALRARQQGQLFPMATNTGGRR